MQATRSHSQRQAFQIRQFDLHVTISSMGQYFQRDANACDLTEEQLEELIMQSALPSKEIQRLRRLYLQVTLMQLAIMHLRAITHTVCDDSTQMMGWKMG